MLPSILSEQVLHGLKSFITTGFETQTPLFEGMFSRFVNQQGKLFKGPYLSVDLPFRQGMDSRDYFSQFKTAFPPYLHQEQAWQRISSNKDAMPTIVATGTGSGKTECFLYPVLEHCALAQEKGIKAIVIYPMNALATDQAKRFASVISNSPALKGKLRVGLFVGGDEGESGSKQMSADQVITDKNRLRDEPPDILLTNYKMLDFLLIRPKDQKLWQHNTPETLKYLIVDELHTFDGAQGTDLSCLVRRMKARLQTPAQHMICVGTSATLGDDSSIEGLTGFASKVFQESFDAESVVGETRLTADEFIGDADQDYDFFLPFNFEERLNWQNYDDEKAYIEAQFKLLFPNMPVSDIEDKSWRVELGNKLKRHRLFRTLLRQLSEKAYPVEDLSVSFLKLFPVNTNVQTSQHLILSMCALIAWARSTPDESKDEVKVILPWAFLRLQLWLRELRRMVVPLKTEESSESSPHELCFYDDLKKDESIGVYLPVVQCTQCHATAWAGVKPKEQNTLVTELRQIYNAYFSHLPEIVMLFPVNEDTAIPKPPESKGWVKHLCTSCATLQQSGESCHACGKDELIQVYQPDFIHETKTKGTPRLVAEHHCPMCRSQHSMMVFGARSASLSSVAISHSYASHFNDDKQLITFSDNVQDAAHRAGFFAARTWQHNVRMAITQAIPEDEPMSLEAFYSHLSAFWRDQSLNELAMNDERYISEFIAPNMLYYSDYVAMTEPDGRLPDGSNLISEINTRLEWEILAEFGYRGGVGRSLQRTGTASVGIDPEKITQVIKVVYDALHEHLAIPQLTDQSVSYFITGLLLQLKRRGAIFNPLLEGYWKSGGKSYLLNKLSYLPAFAEHSNAPIFICNKNSHPEFDCLINKKGMSWYQDWCRKTLFGGEALTLTGQNIEAEIYTLVLPLLVSQGLLIEQETSGYKLWGLDPACLFISKQLVKLETQQYKDFYIPEILLPFVEGMPSLIINDPHTFSVGEVNKSNWLKDMYNHGEIHRVIAHEHTGLLERKRREAVENDFMKGGKSWSLNLLSATPTLEMGIDIGDLSSVLLCSVPPAQANYLQRIGRAGRRDGNAFNLTVAQGSPHDLHFYADPREMMVGAVESPDVYLNATSVMSRQLIAFCMDNWVASGVDTSAIPMRMSEVLNAVERGDLKIFPYNFLGFVNKHADDLIEGFLGLFGEQLNAFTQDYLKEYLLGSGDIKGQGSLETKLVGFLFDLVQERLSLKEKIEQLRKHLNKLEKLPKDESVIREISEVQIERDGLSAIVRKINGKQVLNFFTDEGLLPNYAFPESGVTLRSVIFQKRTNPKEGESAYENKVFEYERAGSSAISELAPESTFYAGGRKVSIQQVDLKLSPIEPWRFCPSCQYSEQDLGTHEAACPRCHDPMWADSGQRLQMLRMRQVMANTSDKDSRIGDDSDDREPMFYSRQLLPDFDPKSTESAYAINSATFPFGFEFIRKVDFREVNFGQFGGAEEEKRIAGEEMSRPGFKLCKHCGMVQDKSKEQNHAYSCTHKQQPSEDSIIDCLYLYREFNSEALRILLPVQSVEGSERDLNSFIAGLQLGLKRKFGGKVDHLRAMSYSAPLPDSDARRHYLMIYDSVPGGTGYLQDLMSKPEHLLEVFKLARDVMAGCECNHSENDGCYHCLYAYRNSHGMESTSRQRAVELFSNILDLSGKLEKVTGIETIKPVSGMDSELEARFIEAFRRYALKHKYDLRINPQVIQGKPGYFLQVGERDYQIELQVPMGEKQGVSIYSKPDFLIRASRADTDFLPLAIFMDGYEYHQHSATEDTLKRMALVESGQYFQWSLTWADVNEQFATSHTISRNPFNENQNEVLGAQQKQMSERLDVKDLRHLPMSSPFEQLLAYLIEPDVRRWQSMVFCHALGWFGSNMQAPDFIEKVKKTYKANTAPVLADEFSDDSAPAVFAGLSIDAPKDPLSIVCKLPLSAIQQLEPREFVCSVNLDNSKDAKQLEAFKAAWHGFLKVYNLFQFLPRGGFFTSEGGKSGAYDSLAWRAVAIDEPEAIVSVNGEQLTELLEEVLDEFRDSVVQIAKRSMPLPSVGFDLEDDIGEVLAEAEFCWESLKIVGLYDRQLESAGLFKQSGWVVLSLDATGEWLETFESMISESV